MTDWPFPLSDRPELDYEATLAALQALLGQRVLVTVADLTSFLVAATFTGELHSAEDGEELVRAPGLEEYAGDDFGDDDELIAFIVGSPESAEAGAAGSFLVWKSRFEVGFRLSADEDGGDGVAFVVGQVRTQVALL